jgi:hypothetical protein
VTVAAAGVWRAIIVCTGSSSSRRSQSTRTTSCSTVTIGRLGVRTALVACHVPQCVVVLRCHDCCLRRRDHCHNVCTAIVPAETNADPAALAAVPCQVASSHGAKSLAIVYDSVSRAAAPRATAIFRGPSAGRKRRRRPKVASLAALAIAGLSTDARPAPYLSIWLTAPVCSQLPRPPIARRVRAGAAAAAARQQQKARRTKEEELAASGD